MTQARMILEHGDGERVMSEHAMFDLSSSVWTRLDIAGGVYSQNLRRASIHGRLFTETLARGCDSLPFYGPRCG